MRLFKHEIIICSLFSHPIFFLCPTDSALHLSHGSSQFSLIVLASSFCLPFSFFVSFMPFLCTSVPAALTSCPAIEGSGGRRGMLILSPQQHSVREGEKEVENVTRHRKWDGHLLCVCVCLSVCVGVCASQKIRVSVWLTFPVFFLFYFASLPSELYINVCV